MHFTNFGGFQGLLSYFRYIPKYLTAQQIYGLYLHDKKKWQNSSFETILYVVSILISWN